MNLNSESVEKAREMSLDEYIAKSGLYVSSRIRQPRPEGSINTRTSRMEDPEDDDNLMDDIDEILLEKQNTSSDNEIESHDLRKKLSNTSIKQEFDNIFKDNEESLLNNTSELNSFCEKQSMPPFNAQQWRLMEPNVNCDIRPPGMPPLVMRDAAGPFNVRERNRRRQSNSNNLNNNQKMGYRKNINKNHYNHGTNGLNNRNRKQESSFIKLLNCQQNKLNNGEKPQDLMITVPTEAVGARRPPSTKVSNVPQLNLIDANEISTNALTTNAMAIMARNLLDSLQNVVAPAASIPKEKYDFKIQKDIHALQKKPFVFTCGATNEDKPAVLSYDGPGVNNTSMNPSTTGISLNQRFA